MKHLLRLTLQLYPPWWRRRYSTEFEALLDDINPGWRTLLNVINGAITMHIRTILTIPVVCALAGVLVGGVMATRTPTLYASSATIWLDAAEVTGSQPKRAQEFRVPLKNALGNAGVVPGATTVTLHSDSDRTTIRLTYSDRDPMLAQRGAERLVAAIATRGGELAKSTEVLDPPSLPATPVAPDYLMMAAGGGAVGLVAGGLVGLLFSWRRPPVHSPPA